MKKLYLLISLVFVISLNINAQTKSYKELYFEAESYLDAGNYNEALNIYLDLLQKDNENANINFKIGFCYVNTILDKDKAIPYLEKAAKNISNSYNGDNEKEKKAPIDVLFWLGKAYHVNYKFNEAIAKLNEFKSMISQDNIDIINQINQTIEYCKNGIELVKNPVKFNITNLGSGINTEYSEHSPVFSADESVLIFTSKREGTTGNLKLDNGEFYEDIYITNKRENGMWDTPKTIGTNINTESNEATIGLSVDGQTLFIYKDDNGDGNIYISTLNGDVWSTPTKLGPTINTKSKETHASLSADGRFLYFTSDRKGGYGGLDIYVVKRLPNGEWSEAQNLGPKINSPLNEEGPYIHPDGVTLFYSSEGGKSMGGYDIFFTVIDNESRTCEEPTNIGYPINTTQNDVFYVPTPDGRRAYYASYQEGGIGSSDLYLITLPDSKEKPLTVMSGVITMSSGKKPINVNITVTDMKNQNVVGVYAPNSKTGKFLFILTPGEYNVLYESDDNLYFSENIVVEEQSSYKQINKAINLSPIVIGDPHEKYYAEFDKNSSKLNDKINDELTKLYDLLNINKHLVLDIIFPESNTNKKLNTARKKEIISYMENKGIDIYRIMSDLPVSPEQDNIVELHITEKDDVLASNNVVKNTNTTNNNTNNNTNNTTTNNTQVSGSDIVISNIFFDFDKAQTDEYYNTLNKLSEYMIANKDAIIEIHGYTDLQGDENYNIQLSLRRANFAKDYLVKKGVSKDALKIKGFGESNQISADYSPDSRKYNRRVEFKVLVQGNYKLTVEPVAVPEKYKL